MEAIQREQENLEHDVSVLLGIRKQKAVEEYWLNEREAEERRKEGDAEEVESAEERQGKKNNRVPKEWEELEIASDTESKTELLRSSTDKGESDQKGRMLLLLIK
ncbi:hypothetical protein chiPu_0020328 [Chiloscyllium punctatum]|uniref:Uncharacterized protein n=1 Tax=Chiloscyllium punctatum TaxID=137246 RepID=A0A401REF0_CHIPU|nr:hypothetical protein [Chiloscyllium punctatum]